ncbi:MAG TPA: hypothetical protein VFI73_01975 [Candidatus Nitrosopolaris sp.]|nr:hypothetical protein [Candidatus Nitrosopolaris sp.]
MLTSDEARIDAIFDYSEYVGTETVELKTDTDGGVIVYNSNRMIINRMPVNYRYDKAVDDVLV